MRQRKRKLIIDKFNLIDVQKMQRQVWDTKDIVTSLDLAPHNKSIMNLKENSSVEKMLTTPAKPFHHTQHFTAVSCISILHFLLNSLGCSQAGILL